MKTLQKKRIIISIKKFRVIRRLARAEASDQDQLRGGVFRCNEIGGDDDSKAKSKCFGFYSPGDLMSKGDKVNGRGLGARTKLMSSCSSLQNQHSQKMLTLLKTDLKFKSGAKECLERVIRVVTVVLVAVVLWAVVVEILVVKIILILLELC